MTLSTDPSFHVKLAEYRRKAADGSITLDEMREAVKLMRQGRVAAAATSAASRTRKAASGKPSASADDLLNELEGL